MQHYEEVQTSASDLLDSQDSTGEAENASSKWLDSQRARWTRCTMGEVQAGEQGLGMEGPYEVLRDSSP